MSDSEAGGFDPSVVRASLDSAHSYTAAFNPNIDYLPYIDRFELHLTNWARRYEGAND